MMSNRQNLSKQNLLRRGLIKQRGASFWGIAFNVGILIFMAFVAVRIGGLYYDDYLVSSTLKELENEAFLTKKSPRKIHEMIRIKNDFNNVSLDKDEVVVSKLSDRIVVDIAYEKRVPVVSNIDVIVSFEHHFEAIKN